MVAACLLGRLYSITADETIERMRMGHTGRGDVLHARAHNIKLNETITVPDTATQQQMIRQILSVSEEMYKSIIRKDEDSHVMERRTVQRGIGVPVFNPPEIDPFGPKVVKQNTRRGNASSVGSVAMEEKKVEHLVESKVTEDEGKIEQEEEREEEEKNKEEKGEEEEEEKLKQRKGGSSLEGRTGGDASEGKTAESGPENDSEESEEPSKKEEKRKKKKKKKKKKKSKKEEGFIRRIAEETS